MIKKAIKKHKIIYLSTLLILAAGLSYADSPPPDNTFDVTTALVVQNKTSSDLHLKTQIVNGTDSDPNANNYIFKESDPQTHYYPNYSATIDQGDSIAINYFNYIMNLGGSPISYYMSIFKATGTGSPKYIEVCDLLISSNVYYDHTEGGDNYYYHHPFIMSIYNNSNDTSEYCTNNDNQPKRSVVLIPKHLNTMIGVTGYDPDPVAINENPVEVDVVNQQ